jgi:hypothetical protein
VAHGLLLVPAMRTPARSAVCLALVTACVAGGSPDGKDDEGLGAGKADGEELSDCEKGAIVAYLNEGVTEDKLIDAGVHDAAAKALVAHRDGADATFGTEDDNKFDSIEEVDEVDFTGRVAFEQLVAATANRCAVDIYADARDVTKPLVVFPAGAVAPTSYDYPSADGFSMGGTEFWQKWSGGKNPTYSFGEGTDAGRMCMQASAIRFETIMKDPPAELVKLRDETNWSGSFFNWNDDYSDPSAWGDGSAARLWAWRTTLIKWISQTKKDGSCLVPTRELVIKAAVSCLERGAEIQGCSAQ